MSYNYTERIENRSTSWDDDGFPPSFRMSSHSDYWSGTVELEGNLIVTFAFAPCYNSVTRVYDP